MSIESNEVRELRVQLTIYFHILKMWLMQGYVVLLMIFVGLGWLKLYMHWWNICFYARFIWHCVRARVCAERQKANSPFIGNRRWFLLMLLLLFIELRIWRDIETFKFHYVKCNDILTHSMSKRARFFFFRNKMQSAKMRAPFNRLKSRQRFFFFFFFIRSLALSLPFIISALISLATFYLFLCCEFWSKIVQYDKLLSRKVNKYLKMN